MQRDLLQQIDREDNENVYRKTYQTGSEALFFAQCRDQNETWVPLFEKAYAKAHGDYASLVGGWIGEGVEDLSGGVTAELLTSDILDIDEFWDKEMSRVNDEFLFGASTGLLEHGYGERNGISEGHAYVVMEARTLKSGHSSLASAWLNFVTLGARSARVSGRELGVMGLKNGLLRCRRKWITSLAATLSSGFLTRILFGNIPTSTAPDFSAIATGDAASAGLVLMHRGRRLIMRSSISS
ncbi:hypothetical protein IL306_000384 [Fusarium sp. DS 682]|nr:hypothetical protein IL306_000384 [Fusarium sp. DS 682]